MSAEVPVWLESERALYEACRAASRGEGVVHSGQLAQLLTLIRAVYERAHAKKIKRLAKAGELTGAQRLLRSEALYGRALLAERLALLMYVLADSAQRPVAEQAALGLLELELSYDWASDAARVAAVGEAILASPVKTLTAFGLANHLKLPAAQTLKEGFVRLGLEERRARIAELVGLIDAYGEEPGINALVSGTFEALFRGLDGEGKAALVGRLFREITERRGRREVPWHLLLDPLLAQNVSNQAIQARVLELLDTVDAAHGERYALIHLRHNAPEAIERRAVRFLKEHGTRRAIPALHALAELPASFFLFVDRHAALREQARAARDAIIEREQLHGLESGALTLAEGQGGELSLSGSPGELSLAADAELEGYPMAALAARRSWWARLIDALGLLWARLRGR